MSTIARKPATWLRDTLTAETTRENIQNSLGKSMDADYFVAQCLVCLNDESLADCTPESKYKAAFDMAVMGLLPTHKQVALIPRNIKGKGRCVTVMPQWQGLRDTMLRSPGVKDITATLVHRTDQYEYDPATRTLTHHTFDPFDDKRIFQKIDDVRGGYVVVTFHDPKTPEKWHYVTADTIRKAMACAQTKDVWQKWFYEQCLKTLYRNAYARRIVNVDPLAAMQMEKTLKAEDEALGNDPQQVEAIAPKVIETRPKVSRTQRLVEQFDEPEPEQTPEPEIIEVEQEPEPEQQTTEEWIDQKTDKPAAKAKKSDKPSAEYLKLKARVQAAKSIDDLNAVMDDAGAAVSIKEISVEEHTNLVDLSQEVAGGLD